VVCLEQRCRDVLENALSASGRAVVVLPSRSWSASERRFCRYMTVWREKRSERQKIETVK
jgi:hypothetical protein